MLFDELSPVLLNVVKRVFGVDHVLLVLRIQLIVRLLFTR